MMQQRPAKKHNKSLDTYSRDGNGMDSCIKSRKCYQIISLFAALNRLVGQTLRESNIVSRCHSWTNCKKYESFCQNDFVQKFSYTIIGRDPIKDTYCFNIELGDERTFLTSLEDNFGNDEALIPADIVAQLVKIKTLEFTLKIKRKNFIFKSIIIKIVF